MQRRRNRSQRYVQLEVVLRAMNGGVEVGSDIRLVPFNVDDIEASREGVECVSKPQKTDTHDKRQVHIYYVQKCNCVSRPLFLCGPRTWDAAYSLRVRWEISSPSCCIPVLPVWPNRQGLLNTIGRLWRMRGRKYVHPDVANTADSAAAVLQCLEGSSRRYRLSWHRCNM